MFTLILLAAFFAGWIFIEFLFWGRRAPLTFNFAGGFIFCVVLTYLLR